MSKPANPKLIGAFVLGALALTIAGIVVLGGGKIFQRTLPVVMFFDGSVAGLTAGSPVNFRGVRIGQVTQVFIEAREDHPPQLVIPVLAEITATNLRFTAASETAPGLWETIRPPGGGKALKGLITNGLRAQLAMPSLITGQASVSLDFYPSTPAEPTGRFPDRLEIPTVPSTLQEVEATFQQVMDKLSQLPLEDLVDDVRSLIKGASQLVNDPDVMQSIADAGQILADLRQVTQGFDARMAALLASLETTSSAAGRTFQESQQTLRQLDARLETLLVSADRTMRAAEQTLTQTDRTLQSVSGLVAPGSPAHFELMMTLQETTAAARALRDLADQLQRNPNSLLFGRPPGRGTP